MFTAIFWLLVGVIVLLLATVWIRKHFLSGGADDVTAPAGFTLGDLRQLHKNGQMTDEEFERAKAQLVSATKKAAERIPENPAFKRKLGPPQTGFDVLPPRSDDEADRR